MSDPKTSRLVATTLVVLCLTTAPALAQITTGTVSGSVKDSQGAIVPGATVSLVNTERGSATDTTTNASGDFVFANVTAGTYTIRVTMNGFKTLERLASRSAPVTACSCQRSR